MIAVDTSVATAKQPHPGVLAGRREDVPVSACRLPAAHRSMTSRTHRRIDAPTEDAAALVTAETPLPTEGVEQG